MEKVSSFRERFCELCKENGISQLALAKQLHVAGQTISSWQNGIRTPKTPTIMTIAGYFKVNPDWLRGYDSEKRAENSNKISFKTETDLAKGIIGSNIRLMRKQRGITQAELADKLGVSTSAITMYETGHREPDYSTLSAIAKELDVPLMSILPNDNDIDYYDDFVDGIRDEPNNGQSTFAERFSELLKENNIRASAVARELGITKQAISSWMSGVRSPKKTTIVAIAQLFNVSTDWLMGLDSQMTPNTNNERLSDAEESKICFHPIQRDSDDTFMNRLKNAMIEKGIKATRLSEVSGVGKSEISHYLKGHYVPKQEKGIMLARALGVDPNWLMMGNEQSDKLSEQLTYNFYISEKANINLLPPEINHILMQVQKLSPAKLDALINILDLMVDVD